MCSVKDVMSVGGENAPSAKVSPFETLKLKNFKVKIDVRINWNTLYPALLICVAEFALASVLPEELLVEVEVGVWGLDETVAQVLPQRVA